MTPDELKRRRAALGLSQTALAALLGVPRNTVWRWEAGELTVEKPVMLALALDQLAHLATAAPRRPGRPAKQRAAIASRSAPAPPR
ncbi:MAG TPA: helix-turn-helix domain-containing protein [Chloroflexota bacterium]|jgi:transcriptional regulator with XRE-family HTH domain|nr:helix-turn-helix domain-containing protein [Chloroflexota bacterium]